LEEVGSKKWSGCEGGGWSSGFVVESVSRGSSLDVGFWTHKAVLDVVVHKLLV